MVKAKMETKDKEEETPTEGKVEEVQKEKSSEKAPEEIKIEEKPKEVVEEKEKPAAKPKDEIEEDLEKPEEEEDRGPEIQIVIFKLNEEEFAADIMNIREITRFGNITRVPGAAEFIDGVINLRGDIIAVMDLNKRLGLDVPAERGIETRIVIAEVENIVVGMIVDSVTEVMKLPEKNIGEPPAIATNKIRRDYIQGVGRLGKRLLILLNLKMILSEEEAVQVGKIKERQTEVMKQERKKGKTKTNNQKTG